MSQGNVEIDGPTVLALTLAGALAVTLLAAAPALAETVTYRATADSYTSSLNPSSNFGTSERLRIGHNGVGRNNRAYLKFPTTAVYDPDCQVASSKLRFLSDIEELPWGDNFWVAPTAAGWRESTIKWNNQPGPVTSAELNAFWFYTPEIVEADVTEAVQYLDNNAIPGRGLVVRSKTAGDAVDVEQAVSSEAGTPWPRLRTEWTC
jgi:hypothetical protein